MASETTPINISLNLTHTPTTPTFSVLKLDVRGHFLSFDLTPSLSIIIDGMDEQAVAEATKIGQAFLDAALELRVQLRCK